MKLVCNLFKYIIFLLIIKNQCFAQKTVLENYRSFYRLLRYGAFEFIGRTDTDWAYKWNLDRDKVQKPFPKSQEFFCDPNGPGRRSDTPPVSVHKLRPGDIDIVAAIGDSLTAGNGALATNILQVLIENKGISWCIGGQDTWHKYLTLPNILKVFNPNLYGYSLSDGYSVQRLSRFNVAEPGAMSRDIPYEAKILVERMISDPNVDIKQHWKLITILIGANDFCSDLCFMKIPEKSEELHEIDLISTLRTIRDNLPRTIINLVTPPNLRVINEFIQKPYECEASHHFECPCLFGLKYTKNRQRYYSIMERWKKVVVKVANMKEFNDREDFTVINQPFLVNVTYPRLPSGGSDFTYMSLDCFHLSQKGYALASNALWNNMLEPEGQKSDDWKKEFTEIKCPTSDRPFIATRENS